MTVIQIEGKEITEAFRQIVREEIASALLLKMEEPKTGKFVYNLKDLAEFLHVSAPVAQRLKNEGKIPYKQTGHKFIYDCDAIFKALEHKDKKKMRNNN
ncbi:MAG: DUF3853 family protein [Mariniphaga sp.]